MISISAVCGLRSITVVFVIRFAIVLGSLVLCIIALILWLSTSLNTIQMACVVGIILLLALFFFSYIHNWTKKRKL
ncbi:hypothetical protein [Priestia megaterium]|uniref:hypothetical protein n=1 Tax=Priestia megaterium TaxID=1404 RepID=UPI0004AEE55B|nr:hypothetical protein [Priestia megaterium]